MSDKTLLVRIEGKVQGVWYRAWTEQTAKQRGLNGWVRNRPDGSVQALFSGPADQVDAMVGDCHKGPPLARVTKVSAEPANPESGSAEPVSPELVSGFSQVQDG